MRLDKYLALSGEHTRSEATRMLRAGLVLVNGQPARSGAYQLALGDEVLLNGQPVGGQRFYYLLLHKPAGLLTAARDKSAPTVAGLLPDSLLRRGVMPVGRLDKDTTGLLLMTNDGELAHRLLSPKRHVWKTYLATVSGQLAPQDVEAFAQGLDLGDFTSQPARLTILKAEPLQSLTQVEVHEGKFHQVKRMFLARGHEVLALSRVAFGSLSLPGELAPGQYRPLTPEELEALKRCAYPAQPRSGDEQSHE